MAQQQILPPQCIGILGGGQLGLMLGLAAKQMGYMVAILEPDPHAPAARVADTHIQTAYSDQAGLKQLASLCQVITTEFENIPAQAVEFLSTKVAVYPSAAAILIAQNRIQEKTFFHSLGLATADFLAINSLLDCQQAEQHLFPAILKTATLGYDGKGQVKVTHKSELAEAYSSLHHPQCILEKMLELDQEVSIIVARNSHGSLNFPLIENQHRNGILNISYIPAQINPDLAKQAQAAALKIVEALDYTGLLSIEFFITKQQQLVLNEMAPRPHNSGHITSETCVTSQFEQQLRAICGLPLGPTRLKEPGAMLNLLGEVWLNKGVDPFATLSAVANSKLHWYGKKEAKPGRKMGHVCISGGSYAELSSQLQQLATQLAIDTLL